LSGCCLITVAFLFALLFSPISSHAYDGPVLIKLKATGLQIGVRPNIPAQSTTIKMSKDLVNIRYELKNVGEKDLTSYLYFSLPAIQPRHADNRAAFAQPLGDNPVRLDVKVNGEAIDFQTQQRAVYMGLDISDKLRASGLPLSPFGSDLTKAMKALSSKTLSDLSDQGIVSHWGASWDLMTTHYWRQDFPAKQTQNIEISYKPVFGMFVDSFLKMGDKIVLGLEAENSDFLCMTKAQKMELNARFAHAKTEEGDRPYTIFPIIFDLVNVNKQYGSIGKLSFQIETKNPGDIVSVCGGDFKKTGPKNFEWKSEVADEYSNMKIFILELDKKYEESSK